MAAYLVLEDGSIFSGEARGNFRETVCEIVFNTSMTGYLETLTDPSYVSQGVVMTYPLIGNYGVCREDFESENLKPSAFIVHELCDNPSNFRNELPLEDLLVEHNIPCISGVDTRAIVKKLRESGTMRGILTQNIDDTEILKEKIYAFNEDDLVPSVSCREKYFIGEENTGYKIALLDFGAKNNIGRCLASKNCRVTVFPHDTKATEITNGSFDGIMLSNGPGDPASCKEIIDEIKILSTSNIPIFGICLGHQLMALANGAKTEKMKYGHRGANHPVKCLKLDKTFLSSQNHGYMVSSEGLSENMEISYINVNDKSVEGINYLDKPIRTVQFHPEAAPGPFDTAFLFDEFLKMIEDKKEGKS